MADPSSIVKVEEEVKETPVFILNGKKEKPRWNKSDWRLECRYCSARRVSKYMINVPKNEEKLLKWAEILGQQFLENVQKHRENQICWNHFEDPEKSISSYPTRDNLPIAGGRKEQTQNKKQTCICRYCGVSCLSKNMTRVPSNEELLLKWAEILGPKFLENVITHKISLICWSHFKYRDEKCRSVYNLPFADITMNKDLADNLPIADEMINEDLINKEFTCVCRYCGASCFKKNMTRVPTNEDLLLKWADILGPKFLENVITHKTGFICWSHFKYRDEKCRSVWNLPMADIIMNGELADKQVKVEEMESEQKPDVEMLIHEIKTEEEENESDLASDHAYSTASSPDDDNKLLIIPKDE